MREGEIKEQVKVKHPVVLGDLQRGRLQQLEAVAEKVGPTFSIKNLHQRKQS